MMELPQGWFESTFAECNRVQSQTLDPMQFGDEVFELYSVPSFPSGKPEIVKGRDIGSTKQLVEADDVLVCKINPRINRVWQVSYPTGFRQIASSEWIVMRAPGLNPAYLKYYFSSPAFRELICDGVTGVGGSLTRAQPKNVALFSIPVAPLNEQKHIADKLDLLLAQVDVCRERLDRLAALIKRFREAVLDAATSGTLTEDWREVHNISSPIDVTLGDFVTHVNYGTSAKSAPSGSTPVLRMGNIQDGRIDWSDLVYTSDRTEVEKYLLQPGDVLFNRTNSPELVGKTAVFNGERQAIFAGYLIRFRCGNKLLPNYINQCLNSPAGKEFCWRVKSDGVSQSNINAKKLLAFSFLLPSLDEQREIVRRVEKLFAFADSLANRLQSVYEAVDQVTPALLSKAFRGELVEQDPNDEPASVLLERIKNTPVEKKRVPRNPAAIRTKVVAKTLNEIASTHLTDILRAQGAPVSPEELLRLSELTVDDFYTQIKQEMETIRDIRPDEKTRFLEATA